MCLCPAGAASEHLGGIIGFSTQMGESSTREGPALSNPLNAGSFPLRSCKSCAPAGEGLGGDALAPGSVPLPVRLRRDRLR